MFSKIFTIVLFLLFSNSAFSQLNGSYTIGSGGDYTSIVSAVNDLETQGINGPVVFNIITGTYNEVIMIESITGASLLNTITFQSESGDQNDVLLSDSSNGPVVTLNGTDYISFKNISVSNNHISGIGFQISGSCDEATLNNNRITCSSTSSFAIYSNDASTRNLKIEQNYIDANTGIYLSGPQRSVGTKIINNQIRRLVGITCSNQDSLFIERNQINVESFSIEVGGGVTLYYNAFAVTLTHCNQYLSVNKNKIFSTGTPRYEWTRGLTIDSCNFQNAQIANNFIYSVEKETVKISNSSNINFYFNSVNMIIGYSPISGTCLSLSYTTSCNVKNNIFEGYNNFMESNVSLSSDYNCYYGTEKFLQLPFIFNYNGNQYLFFEDFTAASNTDSNSVVQPVYFTDGLHLAGSSIGDTNLIGIPITGITHDIDDEPRNPLYPYMGADEADIVLPVELTSFTHSVNGNNVILNWMTSSETNNSGFDIERSIVQNEINNESWQTIGFVEGNGTTNSPVEYSFSDNNLSSGKYNYRLKQTDYNGIFSYHNLSSEVFVSVPETFTLFQNYPNPFNPNTIIRYQLSESSYTTLKIYDMSGKEVSTLVNEKQDAGYYSVNFSATGGGISLSSGVYFYTLQSGSFTETKRMTLIK